ncbi:MAG: class I SAM-dependent DNA methyltransferase, partial [Oligoflexia bacterium]|nr:class I SAM-dependent DNA methyltransferase [Oligoflexia bacterium]
MSHNEIVSFIWQVAELLRGPYRPNQYKYVMLPLIVLRRLDCVLEPTKEKVLAKAKSLKGGKVKNIELILNRTANQKFHNKSEFSFEKLKADPDNISANLTNFMKGFSERARNIVDHFEFEKQILKLEKHNLLYKVISKFYEIDLHIEKVDNIQMGYIFEELIRRFNEASNEEAGDHFTPREVIRLMVDLLFNPDDNILSKKGIIKTLFDPACGTGGMLSVASDYVRELNPQAQLEVFGQDYNSEAYAICGSDMMIKREDIDHIQFGDSFTEDQFPQKTFGYMLANPPFGVEWKPEENFVKKEHSEQGFSGRFGAGLPRISDGSLLFLQHMISKMKGLKEGGTRLAIVFNGSPLFTGSAGSGESEIRKWIIEKDWLEAIVALPDQLFYNTGIHTYIWILTNRKEKHRKKKIQLINAVSFFEKMRKSLGKKRHQITEEQKNDITKLYGAFKEGEFVRIFDSEDFGYYRITVERPLRLNFQVNDERLGQLKESKAFFNLAISKKKKKIKEAEEEIKKGKKQQENILVVLSKLKSKNIIKNREKFVSFLKEEFKKANLKISSSLFKAILQSLSKRDETADICKSSKGNPEP